MKKFFNLFPAIAMIIAVLASGCSSIAAVQAKSPAVPPAKQINVALYVDDGAGGNGMFCWASLLEFSPEIKLHLVLAKDIRAGRLDKMDVLLMPGGYPGTQYKTLQAQGVKAVREFVANGGAYIGSCAGLANVLNNNERLRLLPFRRRPASGGYHATLAVDINQRGAEILNVKPGRVMVRYAGGPIPAPGKKVHQVSTGEVLAIYKNTVSYIGKAEGNFFNQGAVIFGTYGKGKVIATSFHPESWPSTHNIAMGCIYAVTGVKTAPVMPEKVKRPLRVGYYCVGKDNVENIEAMLRLSKDPELDIIFISNQQINEGMLSHLDMLVLPDAVEKYYKLLVTNEFLRNEMDSFINRGGKVFTAGRGINALTDRSKAVFVKDNRKLTPELLLEHKF